MSFFKVKIDPMGVIKASNEFLKAEAKLVEAKPTVSSEVAKWERPDESWIKLNCDAAFEADCSTKYTVNAGLGIVARDDRGNFLTEKAILVHAESVVEAKAMALREAVYLAN